MIYILKGSEIKLDWTILKGYSYEKENFKKVLLKVFLVSERDRLPVQAKVDRDVLGMVHVTIDSEADLDEGIYGLKMIWCKNQLPIPEINQRDLDWVNARSIAMTEISEVFAITENASLVSYPGREQRFSFKTNTATYGYDGLDAYERAILLDKWIGSETSWLSGDYSGFFTEMWRRMGEEGDEQIDASHLNFLEDYAKTDDVVEKSDAAQLIADNAVTSVGVSVPAGFVVSGAPVTSSGVIEIKFAEGYSLPTSAKQRRWDTVAGIVLDSALQDFDADDVSAWKQTSQTVSGITNIDLLKGITQSDISHWNEAYQKMLTGNLSGNDTRISDDDIENWNIAYNAIASNSVLSHLFYDADNNAIRCDIGLYATWVSAVGANADAGSADALVEAVIKGIIESYGYQTEAQVRQLISGLSTFKAGDMWTELANDNASNKIHISHIPDITSLLSGYATEDWVNTQGFAKNANLNTSNWDEAYSKSHEHTNKTVLDGISSDDTTHWGQAYTWMNSKKASIEAILNVLSIDSNGYLHSTAGFYSDSFVSALGANGSGVDGSGGSGMDTTTLWSILSSYDNIGNHVIDIRYIPGLSDFALDSTLATVAKTGKYSDLSGIPTKLSDFTDDLNVLTTDNYSDTLDGVYVSKVDGKGLSTNDFDDNYKDAIDNLPESYAPVNAEENVQADWSVTDQSGDAYIRNKPENLSDFKDDATHRLVTDTQIGEWAGAATWITTNKSGVETLLDIFEVDATNGRVHVKSGYGLYADWLSALGANNATSGGGSGTSGNIDATTLWDLLDDDDPTKQIHSSHLVDALGGYATQVWVQQQQYLVASSLNGYLTKTEADGYYLAKGSLEGYAKVSELNTDDWDDAASKAHEHSNKSVLDNLTESVINNSHSHSNKSVLDGITSEIVGHWNAAYTDKHTHANKTVLDGISGDDVTNWNGAYNWVTGKKSSIESILSVLSVDSNGNLHSTVGIYSDSFVSALGSNSATSGGTGGGGFDITSMWAALAENSSHQIDSSHLIAYYTKTEVDGIKTSLEGLITQIPKFAIKVVEALPTSDISTTTIYLKTDADAEDGNLYKEYIYVNGEWELLGEQKVKFDGYLNTSNYSTTLDGRYVQKVSGKGLSTNDFTNDYKTAIDNLPSSYAPVDAEKNVQSDWSVTDATSDAYIKNKPTELSQFADDETHRLVTDSQITNWTSAYTWVFNKKSGVEKLLDIFEVDDTNKTVHVKTSYGLYADWLSAMGVNSATSGGVSGSFDETSLWAALGSNGTNQVDASHLIDALSGYATQAWVNGKGFLTSHQSLDAYMKSADLADWAKASVKPTYTASEVGALADTTFIPTKVSDLENDNKYLTSVAYDDLTTKPTKNQITTILGNYVSTFGSKTGAITLRGSQTANGSINLAMSNNELQASIVGLGGYAYVSNDATHRLVTDSEKSTWNGKQDALTFASTPSSTNKVITQSEISTMLTTANYGTTLDSIYLKKGTTTDLVLANGTTTTKATFLNGYATEDYVTGKGYLTTIDEETFNFLYSLDGNYIFWDDDELRLYANENESVFLTDSNLQGIMTDNEIVAPYAKKLQTSRSIWGQSFDGSRDVSGAMTGITTLNGKVDLQNGIVFGIAYTNQVKANASYSMALGMGVQANAVACLSVGARNIVDGNYGAAFGANNKANSVSTFVANSNNVASGFRASAFGYHNNAQNNDQFVIGKYNNNNSNNIFEVGKGTSDSARSNALSLDWNGNLSLGGNSIKIGGATLTYDATKKTLTLTDDSGEEITFVASGGVTALGGSDS